MNIDDEISYLHRRIEDLISDRHIAKWDEDWDHVECLSEQISSLKSNLETFYELRDQLP